MAILHRESHRTSQVGWLRAAVLGANDGIISVASLLVGVVSAGATSETVLTTGIAGLVAGAMSMAAGEYVSVSTQADTEDADLRRERDELAHQPARELDELAAIYRARGLDENLALEVARQLTERNALEAHARDELGLIDTLRARPLQAALASAASFSAGATIPLAVVVLTPPQHAAVVCVSTALFSLVLLGAIAARVGGAPVMRGAIRVVIWGALAMGLTSMVGKLFGATT